MSAQRRQGGGRAWPAVRCPAAQGESANDYAGAQAYPARKFSNFFIGERDASIGPIDRLMDAKVAAAQAVDAQPAAERRVLGRRAVMPQGLKDGVELGLADHPLGIGATGNGLGGIIEAIERAISAVSVNPGHMKRAARRGFISPPVRFGGTSAADRNVVEMGQDAIFCRINP